MSERRRLVTEEEVLHALEARDLESQERVRAMLLEGGHLEALTEFNTKMREIRTGIDGARRTWEALSEAQRRVLAMLFTGRDLRRAPASRTRYDAIGEPHAEGNVCGIATVRNLAARELVAWDGGAFDPERKAILTERGRFVLKHGREKDSPHA